MRTEIEITNELEQLCSSSGYAYVLSYLCFRDNMILYSVDGITPTDLNKMSSENRLLRTEISTLIGLMIKSELIMEQPSADVMQELIDKTDALMDEVHKSIIEPFKLEFLSDPEKANENPFNNGAFMREAIFYSAESAYPFQFRDFSEIKYKKDNDWFEKNKGYSINDAIKIVKAITKIIEGNFSELRDTFVETHPDDWEYLSPHIINTDEIQKATKIDINLITSFLNSFSITETPINEQFNSISDFNLANAYPFIKFNDHEYLLYQPSYLHQAIYETPFYWMLEDEEYKDKALDNRGEFTEQFCEDCLKSVFGSKRVYKNVNIINSKKEICAEIDVLVTFADRAIILQAKSKKLTIEARKGNDNQLKDDFKKSIQKSYDQGYKCAELLQDSNYVLINNDKEIIEINRKYKEIYIFCVLSDFYPALSMQARQFLKYERSDIIRPPYILDIFTLDILCEFLTSPIYFLSYINRRLKYYDNFIASNEIIILSFHLSHNLYLQKDIDLIQLHDDIGSSLDTAMLVRREGIPGDDTPKGILTNLVNTPLMDFLKKIEHEESVLVVELGFHILELSQDTVEQISYGITEISKLSSSDGESHDITVATSGDSGITIHCNKRPDDIAFASLQNHCELRKYSTKSPKWFGICITPSPKPKLRFAIYADFPWKKNTELDKQVKSFSTSKGIKDLRKAKYKNKRKKKKKIGRNEPCPCGSGKKYKLCHLK